MSDCIACVDIGNSMIKTVIFEAESIVAGSLSRFPVGDAGSAALHLCGFRPAAVFFCSVNPPASMRFYEETLRMELARPVMITSAMNTLLENRYHNPESLGADRLCNAVAAAKLHPQGVKLTVDAGSAINMEIILGSDVFAGGLILPGLSLQRRALAAGTALPEDIPLSPTGEIAGRDTAANIANGIIYGAIGAIEGIAGRVSHEYDAPVSILLTGGDGPTLMPHFTMPVHYDELHTLRGVNILARNNLKWHPGEAVP